MTRRRTRWRWRIATVAAFGMLATAAFAPARAAGPDPTQMSADAIKALQQRLADAGCYRGSIDGAANRSLDDAIEACPDQHPFLRIETGMHSAPIWRIGVDAACRLLATASDDKTVRLWSRPDGKLKRVFRLPIGGGDAGKIYATALSPDGRQLAVGAWDGTRANADNGNSLAIVDLSTGAIQRFGPLDGAIVRIAFSVDGRRVAVGLEGTGGVRILDSATGAELLADRDYGDGAYGLAFSQDGVLVTSSFDGQLRRYAPDFKLITKRAAPGGRHPYSVAIDPSGRRVAVGYNTGGDDTDSETQVSILDAKTLTPLAKGQTSDLRDGDLMSVAWSRDGATLVAGGKASRFAEGEWRTFIRRFDFAGRRLGVDITVVGQSIPDIQPCGEGFAFASLDPVFGLLSARGAAMILQGPHNVDMEGKVGSALTDLQQ